MTSLVSPPPTGSFRNLLFVNDNGVRGIFPTTQYHLDFDVSETIQVRTEAAIFEGDCSIDSTSNLSYTVSGQPPGLEVATTGNGDAFLIGVPEDFSIDDNGIEFYETPRAKENRTFKKTFQVTVTATNKCGSASATFPCVLIKNWNNDKEALIKFVRDTYE